VWPLPPIRRKELIEEYFETANEVDWEPRYNIAPTQSVPIIRQDAGKPGRRFSLARWGLIPYWAKDATIGQGSFNARAKKYRDPGFHRWTCLLLFDVLSDDLLSVIVTVPFHVQNIYSSLAFLATVKASHPVPPCMTTTAR
jgi:hypothetical protein